MEINKCLKKFKLLFDKFFVENFELSSYYSENLIKYLDNDDNKGPGKILDTPFFSDLMMYSLTNIEKATPSAQIFILEIFTILIKNELQFSKISQLQGFHIMAYKINIFTSNTPTPLLIAALKVVNAHTNHYSGIMRLANHKAWTRILKHNVLHRPPKVAQAIYNVLAKLIWKLNEYGEEEILKEVLAFIIQPFRTSEYLKIEVIDIENEKALYEPILPHMNILVAIVRDCDNNPGQDNVFQLLHSNFNVEGPLYVILQMTRNTDLVRLICEFQFNFIFASCREYLRSGVKGQRDIPSEVINLYYNIIHTLLNKRMTSVAMFFFAKCVRIWAKMNTNPFPDTFIRHGRVFNLQNQFITLVLTPLVVYTMVVVTARNDHEFKESLEVYSLKLLKMSSEHIVQAGYAFRTLIETSDTKNIVIQCLREIFKLKGCLNVAQAGMLYQALFYTLKLHVISDGSGDLILNENPLKSFDDVKLLSLVMEAIKMLLKEHDINWYENVEIICLQATLMDLLKQNFMPTKQLLQALDLIDLSIKRFLSPDMALLMESKRGSTLNEIGAIMQSYIQHDEWEVRDSALHMLLTCTEVAFVKYIPLRKLLLENNLIVLAAHAAVTDTEFYVQTTALRCLAAATKMDSLWRELLIAHPNLYIELIRILRNSAEGIVRKEAANFFTEIYVNQKLSEVCTRCLFDVMGDAALNDLHWEVQIEALNFWKNAIKNTMSNRGMIDGIFPSVTFSKEKRKIITLNEKEIMKQLIGIMNELSSIGCLKVLHKCLNEDFSVNVMEQAYDIVKELVRILDYYKFEGVSKDNNIVPNRSSTETHNINVNIFHQDVDQSIDVPMKLLSAPPESQMAMREKITESILNTSDYDLIMHCCENYKQIKTEIMDMSEDLIPPPVGNLIDPNKFLKDFKETDYMALRENKRNWYSGPTNLDLLLDEIFSFEGMRRDITSDCT